ncbi:SIR2 family protein [Arthrobacter sp. AOP36-A1-22]|uniref:SIR2 family protein n=1 Tax=Arthrobacter sp. AOP36-A1-22 TaxID=3457684 RepID=UPI00403344D1
MNQYLERLRSVINDGSAVVIVGAGASKALTGGHPASDWVGLIKNGIERAESNLEGLTDWSIHQRGGLELACQSGDPGELISVASAVGGKLKGFSSQLYSDWLRDTVGSLTVSDESLAESIFRLGCPTLTTNYDTLLEDASGRDSTDWTEVESMRAVFRGASKKVGHLHGIYTKPDSVVLTESDYANIIGNKAAQFVQHTHYASKSFVYIGYGGGLSDPNFSKLIEWHASMFPASQSDHFRLCKDAEALELTRAHAGHDIRVIPYGDDHSKLPAFLNSLSPSENTAAVVPQKWDKLAYARLAITEQVREQIVIGAEFDDVDDLELAQLTVPPVLLPYSHDQFASLRAAKGAARPKRLSANELCNSPKVLIVAGEEHSGLSTALRWLISEASTGHFELPPMYVDMQKASTTAKRPLSSLMNIEARNQRLIDSKKADLPSCVLAVDNITDVGRDTYGKALNDLAALEAPFIVLGCRQGMEDRLENDLPDSFKSVEKIFLGKLSRSDIKALVQLISPARRDEISAEVVDVLRREHLPRNPFTVSLLISLMVQSRTDRSHNSETAVLDDYIHLLLGRNGPVVDARVALDIKNRESVLAELAKSFVRERQGAMSEQKIVSLIGEYFDAVQWKNSPVEVYKNFCSIRILRPVNAEKVQFQQSSYLHLFAAKAAMRDPIFLEELLADPIFFAPIIGHYAALVRNSAPVVQRMREIVQPYVISDVPEGRAFRVSERRAAPESLTTGLGFDEAEDLPEDAHDAHGDAEGISHDDDYDISDDHDRIPFPLVDTSEFEPAEKLSWTVDLVSRVLRDSDEVSDAQLKNQAFADVLCAWGYLVELWEKEEVFAGPIRRIVNAMVENGDVPEDEEEAIAAQMALLLPAFSVMTGISSALASNKLLVSFDELPSNPVFGRSPYGPPMAAIFAAWVQASGWTERLPSLIETHGDRWMVSDFIFVLMMMAYRSQVLSREDEDKILQFLRKRNEQRYVYKDNRTRNYLMGEFLRRVRESRTLQIGKNRPQNTFVAEILESGENEDDDEES